MSTLGASESVLLGTLFLQQFITEFTYNYTAQTSLLKLGVADPVPMDNLKIMAPQANTLAQAVAFPNQPGYSQVIPIHYSNVTMQTWVHANLGF